MESKTLATIEKMIDGLSAGDKLELIERMAHSMRRSAIPGAAEKKLDSLRRLCSDMANWPVNNPSDGVSNRDHDQLLYGGQR